MKAAHRDSIERALVHHNISYSPPEPPGGRSSWLVETNIGRQEMTQAQVTAFCAGLATKEQSVRSL
jgi:hypothetical protein